MRVFFLYSFVITLLVSLGFFTRYYLGSLSAYYLETRVYNIVEYSLLAYFFSLYIKNKSVRKILFYSPIPYFTFCLVDFLNSKEATIAFLPLIFEYLVLLIFIIYFFFEVMQENVVEPIYSKAIFWISVAFIVNFSGNFFLFIYSKNSYADEAFKRQFTIIYSTVTILKNILLSIGVSIKEEHKSNVPPIPHDSDFEPFFPLKNPN